MKKLFNIIKKYFQNDSDFNIEFSENSTVQMDSRKISEGDVFFAINNGNLYIEDVLKKNPALIISDKKEIGIEDSRVIYVEDTVKTMQNIAHEYRKSLPTKIIGITGSNGKTTTKDILFSVLRKCYKVEKTSGNYNNHIGLPFTILSTDEECEVLILEMGMSDLGEIDLLCKIAEPDYGIITNIGLSHMETLKTKENVFKAKGEMLNHIPLDKVFVSGDDEFLKKTLAQKIGYEVEAGEHVLENFVQLKDGIEFTFKFKNVKERYRSALNGKYNSLNMGLAIALAKTLGMEKEDIQRGLDRIELTEMRFEKLLWNGIEVINDAYNASPLSMEAGIETFVQMYGDRIKIAVLGDMLELGEKEIGYHKEVIKKAFENGIEYIYLYGPRMKMALDEEKNNFQNKIDIKSMESRESIREEILKLKEKNPVIFIKGSRGMALEKILN
ncbi:MAG: UDP-N-acetylmuramoyl-tripeptide--D-alanyl-D-alanine ligase [Fusobacteriaceae bacterium]